MFTRSAMSATALAAITLALVAPLPAGAAAALPAPLASGPDFNGDGYDDLAVGVPNESIGAGKRAGAVNVVYGTPTGLFANGNQLWSQDSPDILDSAEHSDHFGSAVGWGDFNADGYDDLAVGVSGEDLGKRSQGAVNVIYGSPSGLTSAGNQLWSQDSDGILDGGARLDEFGFSLVAGDFNGDGFADLAIGVLGERPKTVGAVAIIDGGPGGLQSAGNQLLRQRWDRSRFDEFGLTLAAADFDDDGFADLAIGSPRTDSDDVEDAGAIAIMYGSHQGAGVDRLEQISQGSPLMQGGPVKDADFGSGLSVGDFNGDGFPDLVVAAAYESVDGLPGAGAFAILFGSKDDLTTIGNQLWTLNSPGVLGDAQTYASIDDVSAGDFDGDGFADVAVGFDRYDTEPAGTEDAGAVLTMYGSASGIASAGNQFWTQTCANVDDVSEKHDQFGFSVSSSDFNGDQRADLVVGVPGESFGGLSRAGAADVLDGSAAGLSATGNHEWTQDSPGILDQSEPKDEFGGHLAQH